MAGETCRKTVHVSDLAADAEHVGKILAIARRVAFEVATQCFVMQDMRIFRSEQPVRRYNYRLAVHDLLGFAVIGDEGAVW